MGFDHENIVNPFENRVDNYYNTVENHPKQDSKILTAVSCYENGVGASQLFRKHFNETIPLTSIRRSLNTLMKAGRIEPCGKAPSLLFDSTEIIYRKSKATLF